MSAATYADNQVSTIESFIARAGDPPWLNDIRRQALKRYQTVQWPTTADEEFRRSSVANYRFESYPFETALDGAVHAPVPTDTVGHGLSGRISFLGTRANAVALAPEAVGQGVVLTTLSGLNNQPKVAERVAQTMRAGLSAAENRIAFWHYATITHGAVLYVPRFVEMKEPFLISFEEDTHGLLRAPHLVVVAEEGARFTVIHRAHQADAGEILFNEGVSLHIGAEASVRYYGLQRANIDSSVFGHSYASIGRAAELRHYIAPFGGMFAKYRTDVTMDGPGSDAFLGGVYFPHRDQHVDLRTVQHHEAGKAHSLTLYKGVITHDAHSIYQGLISVAHEALQTDAYLNNKNILLSDTAQADSIPTLNINTNDVRCSHGSTTGKLDERQLYYLHTRGYSPDEARQLLIEGFLEEVVANYPQAVLDEIHLEIAARIAER